MTPISNVRPQGFTLLELMVVLSIIALGVSLTMPNIAISDNSAFNAEIRKAVTTLNYARRIAIVQSAPAVAEFRSEAPAAAGGQVAAKASTDAQPDERHSLWFNENISLGFQDEFEQQPQDSAVISLTFFPQGGSTGGTLYFTQNQRKAMIRVDPITGHIAAAYNGEELQDE